MTGHDPGVVRLPTFHVQLTMPDEFAVLSPRPAAVEGPDLYWTSMEQAAPAAVFTVAVALAPRLIGEVNVVNARERVGLGVGFGVGLGVGSGVGFGVGVGVGLGVAFGVGAGVSAGVGSGVGAGVGFGVGVGVGVGVGSGVAVSIGASDGAVDWTAVPPVGVGAALPWFPPATTDRANRLTMPALTMATFWRPDAWPQPVLRNDMAASLAADQGLVRGAE